MPERHFCCGSAGTYNLLQPEIADGARATQGRAYRQRRSGHRRRRQSRLHGADRALHARPRSCTRSNCSTGRPAGRCRRALRGPAFARAGARTTSRRCRKTRRPDRRRSATQTHRHLVSGPTGRQQSEDSHEFGNFEAFFAEIAGALGADGVNRSEETIRRYGENTMPGGDRPPAGVVYPGLHGRCAADRAGGEQRIRCRSIRSAPATISVSARAPRRRRTGRGRPRPAR